MADSPTGPYVSYEATEGMPMVVRRDEGLLADRSWDVSAPQWNLDLENKFIVFAKPAEESARQTELTVGHLVQLGLGGDELGTGTTGLHSSTAAAANRVQGGPAMAIRFADTEDLGLEPGDKYYGVPIPNSGGVVARYTYTTDENLDGRVDQSEGGEEGDSLPALPVPEPACPLKVSARTIETAHGTVAVKGDGSFIYTPRNGYAGIDVFSYVVTNLATGSTSTESVTLRMLNVAPIVAITGVPGGEVPEDMPVTLGSSVIHPGEGETLTYAWQVTKVAADGMTTERFATGSTADFTFTPNQKGEYIVQLAVTDSAGGTGEAQAKIQDSVPVLYWDANGESGGTGGTGTWDSSSYCWRLGSPTGTLRQWGSGVAVFQGDAGTVTISGTVSPSSIYFYTTGYTVSSGSLALSANTNITVDANVIATVGSTISSGGICKVGGGGSGGRARRAICIHSHL